MVPPGAFTFISKTLKPHLGIPIITSNRINTPQLANQLIQDQVADMVSMARPFLADPEFVNKTRINHEKSINICIACNQACLDQVFKNKTASCLVNPRACHETTLTYLETSTSKKIAVVGGGVAGLAFAYVAGLRGHEITLFEKEEYLGGQFNLAKRIPGKKIFNIP